MAFKGSFAIFQCLSGLSRWTRGIKFLMDSRDRSAEEFVVKMRMIWRHERGNQDRPRKTIAVHSSRRYNKKIRGTATRFFKSVKGFPCFQGE